MVHCRAVAPVGPKHREGGNSPIDDVVRGDAARMRRHLRALLQVSRATRRELDPSHQARTVVDELVQALGAERGFLFLLDESGALTLQAGRSASGDDLEEDAGYSRVLVHEALDFGNIRVVNRTGDSAADRERPGADPRSVLAAPMFLRERVVGVAYVDSRIAKGMFSQHDGELLAALASQVPIALELARVWRTQVEQREALEEEINGRKRVEQALRDSENHYRALLESAYDPIVVVAAETGRVVEANASACELLRRPKKDLLGLPVVELHPADERERYQQMFERAIADGEWVSRDAYIVDPERHRSPVEVSARLVQVGESRVLHMVLRDLARRERLEHDFRQARKLEAVGRLAGGISHDFNNTLALVMAAVDNLEKDRGASWSHYVGAIRAACERGAGLTRQLLAVSRRQVIAPTVVHANDVVRGMTSMIERLLGSNIEVETDFADDLWDVVVDEGQLEQVLINLMVNARDAMPSGGTLTVRTANIAGQDGDSDRVSISVSDNGVGMDAATLERLFEPFFSTKPDGTGLGLATTYGIVQQSRGTIEVESKPGAGARFDIRLPAAVPGVTAAQVSDAGAAAPGTGEATILYVEDDPEVRVMLAEVLEEMGYRVLVAGSGAEALSLFSGASGTIDLIIADVVMPTMDGPELCRRLLKISPETKVLYVSGYTAGALDGQGLLRDGAGFLQKPFSSRTLARRVRELLAETPPRSGA